MEIYLAYRLWSASCPDEMVRSINLRFVVVVVALLLLLLLLLFLLLLPTTVSTYAYYTCFNKQNIYI